MRNDKPMVYLGNTGKLSFLMEMSRLNWGVVMVNDMTRGVRELPFILDNGAFIAWNNGTKWSETLFLESVDKVLKYGKKPDFIILPDIVGGGTKSLELSISWIDKLPREWNKALASQDGQPPNDIINAMAENGVDVWFMGGTNAHKLHAKEFCEAAHRLGKKFHFARCSTLERLCYAVEIGVDSLDSAFPLWTKERFRQFIDCYENGHPQYKLEGLWKLR